LPDVTHAERCTPYIIEMGTEAICSIIGTGLEKTRIQAPMSGSIVGKVISTGKTIRANELDKVDGYHTRVDARTGFTTRNMICAPIRSLTGKGVTGAVQILNRQGETIFTREDEALLNEIANHLSISIESILINQEILRISKQVNREVARFGSGYFRDIPFIAESRAIKDVLDQVRMVCAMPVNVYLEGENGTGKELIARLIHEEGDRQEHPFVAVNCASIPENLMESEFFGYEKGAFTGADKSRKGYFEEADGGILFLDEVADMPQHIQPKFLRAIQEGEGYRLGSSRLVPYRMRIISAANRDLRDEVEKGRFREDLFFRLFSVEIRIPPLRERREDILPMAAAFLEDIRRRFKKKVAGYSTEVLNRFETCQWPGNVRQLRREVERVVALTQPGKTITLDKCSPDLQSKEDLSSLPETATLPDRVRDLEVQMILKALGETMGNRSRAARKLGITRQGLYKKIKRYDLSRIDYSS